MQYFRTSVCTDEIVTIPKCYLKSIGKPPRSVFPLVHVAYDADITCVTPANRVVGLLSEIICYKSYTCPNYLH